MKAQKFFALIILGALISSTVQKESKNKQEETIKKLNAIVSKEVKESATPKPDNSSAIVKIAAPVTPEEDDAEKDEEDSEVESTRQEEKPTTPKPAATTTSTEKPAKGKPVYGEKNSEAAQQTLNELIQMLNRENVGGPYSGSTEQPPSKPKHPHAKGGNDHVQLSHQYQPQQQYYNPPPPPSLPQVPVVYYQEPQQGHYEPQSQYQIPQIQTQIYESCEQPLEPQYEVTNYQQEPHPYQSDPQAYQQQLQYHSNQYEPQPEYINGNNYFNNHQVESYLPAPQPQQDSTIYLSSAPEDNYLPLDDSYGLADDIYLPPPQLQDGYYDEPQHAYEQQQQYGSADPYRWDNNYNIEPQPSCVFRRHAQFDFQLPPPPPPPTLPKFNKNHLKEKFERFMAERDEKLQKFKHPFFFDRKYSKSVEQNSKEVEGEEQQQQQPLMALIREKIQSLPEKKEQVVHQQQQQQAVEVVNDEEEEDYPLPPSVILEKKHHKLPPFMKKGSQFESVEMESN